jgi:diacylglycerol kinase (ATP)
LSEQQPNEPIRNGSGLFRIWRAFMCSLSGYRDAWQGEAAFRQELLLVLVGAPLAFVLADDKVEVALLIGSLFLILITELLNTAVEHVVDRFGGERHPLSRKAKDAGSAAVLTSLICAAVIWGVILFG